VIEYRDVSVTTILHTSPLRIPRGSASRPDLWRAKTALKLINALMTPSSDDAVTARSRAICRVAARIGYVMQQPRCFRTARCSTSRPCRVSSDGRTHAFARAKSLLRGARAPAERSASRYPRLLSGGEQQRGAPGRAAPIAGPRIASDGQQVPRAIHELAPEP
jgi:ABC-type polar amino acid transport system ATPase subunit